MKSLAAPGFWVKYNELPADAKSLADKNYLLWKENPRHPSLHFKPLAAGVWSVRVGAHYRAIGRFQDSATFLWIWIGTHEEYDRIL